MRHTGSALDDPEKSLLQRRSVFSGGFDLQSVCAVVGSDGTREYTILGLLDALVRKSLLIADRSSERTRLSLLETIRQFARNNLSPTDRVPRMPATSRARSRRIGPVGQPPTTRGLCLVHHGDGESAHRLPVGRRPRRS